MQQKIKEGFETLWSEGDGTLFIDHPTDKNKFIQYTEWKTDKILLSFPVSKSNGNTKAEAKAIEKILDKNGHSLDYQAKLNSYQCVLPKNEHLSKLTFTILKKIWGQLSAIHIDAWSV